MKFIALNQAGQVKSPTIIQLNQEHITYFRITDLPGGAATRIDLVSGEHVFVTETPTEILRLIQARSERVE